MDYSPVHIAGVLGAQIIGNVNYEQNIELLVFDTRRIVLPKISVFIALKGDRRDGHQFIQEAQKKGIRCFIVSDLSFCIEGNSSCYILVKDCLSALQKLAYYHRQQFSIPIVGITGSNGKTIVKEWLHEIVCKKYHIVRSPKSYNSQIGVPVSLLQLEKDHELGVFEVGISMTGEMEKLAPMVNCELGILTNIGDAHNSGFKSIEEKLAEKLRLFKEAARIIYCCDHELINRHIQENISIKRRRGWSIRGNPSAWYKINITKVKDGIDIQVTSKERDHSFIIPHFQNLVNQENLFSCLVAAIELAVNDKDIERAISQLPSISHRSELIRGNHGNLIINDSYSFDYSALNAALETLEVHSKGRNKIVILSDFFELENEKKYTEIFDHLDSLNISQVFTIGPQLMKTGKNIAPDFDLLSFKNVDNLIEYFNDHMIQNAAILVKGARKYQLDKVVKLLFEKKHRTVLEINLTALEHNIREYSKLINPTTKIMAVIKASAYGSGGFQLAKKLENIHIDYLSVAYIDEAMELRKAGIQTSILVHNPDPIAAQTMVDLELEVEIFSLKQLSAFLKNLDHNQKGLNIHLKLDTGMHRLGFEAHELDSIISYLKENKLKVQSIFSHLSASEDRGKDNFTLKQILQFERMYKKIADSLGYHPWKHILNSSGIIRFPDQQYELVRLGIGMYGIDTSGELSDRLMKVHTLKTWISQIKTINPGETVGYGVHFEVSRPTRIATLSIGYADGYPRKLGNGLANCYINGKFAKTIGNICMDMTMIDITGMEDISLGQEVELYGNYIDIQTLAKLSGTIPYELLCNISNRVKRVYTEY